MSQLEVRFPGGAAVEAHYKGHTILTDQPDRAGGQDAGPAPFDLFLTSIATCAGYYAMEFCRRRGIATDELKVSLEPVRDADQKRVGMVRLRVSLPPEFPLKYRTAILRAIDQCTVKRHIVEPPAFEVTLSNPVASDSVSR